VVTGSCEVTAGYLRLLAESMFLEAGTCNEVSRAWPTRQRALCVSRQSRGDRLFRQRANDLIDQLAIFE